MSRLAVLVLLMGVVSAAETAVESVDHFWRLPLPEGWTELKLTDAMQARVRGQAMIQSGDTKLSIIVAVRPDGREDPAIDTVFVTQFLDGFIVESRQNGSKYTRSEVALIEWDGLPTGEATATLNDGDADKAVIFRVLAANGFVYTLRAVEERAEAVGPELKAALDAFRLTRKPEPKAPVTEAAGQEVPTGDVNEADGGEEQAGPETAAPTSDKTALVAIAIIAGVGILVAIAFPFLFKKKKSSRRRGRGGTSRIERAAVKDDPGAADGGPQPTPQQRDSQRRPTVRMDPAQQAKAQRDSQRRPTVVRQPERRTTVRMPDAPPKPPTTTKRRRPPG